MQLYRIALIAAVMGSVSLTSGVFAQEQKRIKKKWIQAEESGSHLVENGHSSDIDQTDVPLGGKAGQQSEGRGGSVADSSDKGFSRTGRPTASHGKANRPGITDDCVGPPDFCTIYFGGS
jgi:hypothetical protein